MVMNVCIKGEYKGYNIILNRFGSHSVEGKSVSRSGPSIQFQIPSTESTVWRLVVERSSPGNTWVRRGGRRREEGEG